MPYNIKSEPQGNRRRRDPVKPLPDFAAAIAACETQEEKERLTKQYLELADDIWDLVQQKIANHGIMPDGERGRVAIKYSISEDQVDRFVQRVLWHEAERKKGKKVGTRGRAVMRGKPGRERGKRDLPDEVEQFITDAWRVSSYESLNRYDEPEKIEVRLTRKEIWQLAHKKFSQYKISYAYVCRVIEDFIEANRAKSDYARGQEDAVRDNIPTMDADFGDPNNIHIWDVRPLPLRSKYKGILCTAGLLIGMDASSRKVLRHKLLPRKDINDKGETFGVDFTTQHVRTQIALAILESKRRPRKIYVDNGSIFRDSLRWFLDLLTVEGEPPTELIYSGVEDPRGRGALERLLALIDLFIRFVPGFFHEDNYRKALKEKRKYLFKEFTEIELEFDKFIPIHNGSSHEGTPSPSARYLTGPDVGLTPPSILDLALFGGMVKNLKPGIPNRKGVRYSNVHYDLVSVDPAITDKLISASIARAKVDRLLAEIEELKVIYVKLDDVWEPCLPEGKRKWSGQKQRQYKNAMSQYYADEHKATVERLQLALLDELGRKLVFDRYHHEPTWFDPGLQGDVDNLEIVDGATDIGQFDDRLPTGETIVPTGSTPKDADNGPIVSKGVPTKSKPNGNSLASDTKITAPKQPDTPIDDDEDDIPNFMLQRMEQLKRQQVQEAR